MGMDGDDTDTRCDCSELKPLDIEYADPMREAARKVRQQLQRDAMRTYV